MSILLIPAVFGASVGTVAAESWPLRPNIYGMQIATSGGGKGHMAKMLLKGFLPRFNLPELGGDSLAAICGMANDGAAHGLYYIDEVKKIVDGSSVVATQITTTMLAAYDEGRLRFITRPKGQMNVMEIKPAAPSFLISGQPGVRRDIAPTLVARGDAHTQKGRWYAGCGQGDRFLYKG